MSVVWAFNPGFYADEELVERFCVRGAALETLVNASRAHTATNQHSLVIGQRGFGKTMLLRRFAAEIRRDPELEPRWFPIVFAEESYPVASAGELWLEALTHLADATGDDRWQRAYVELRRERNEARLRARALAQLLDFADERGRGLIVVVENVDKLLGDLPDSDGWALRETLLHERRIQLVAAAPRRFEGVDDPSQPFYELFRRIQLDPLTDAEIAALWKGTNGEDLPAGRAIALRILTGGNPRLVVLLASIAKGMALRELVHELAGLIDQHTNYFNANIEAITSNDMRRVFLALAEHWAPATAREIAEATRSDVNKTSTLLGRLVDQGRVEVVREGRARTYQVAERLYNIYYLMRRRGVHEARLAALVDFMALFLEPRQLPDLLARFASEACDPAGERALTAALIERFTKKGGPEFLAGFLEQVPREYLAADHAPKALKRKLKTPAALIALLGRPDGEEWVQDAVTAVLQLVFAGRAHDALPLARATVARLPSGVSVARDLCGWALALAGEEREFLQTCPPRSGGPDYLGLCWFISAMQGGRPNEAMAFLDDFELHFGEVRARLSPESLVEGARWIAECHVRAGDIERALSMAEDHRHSAVFSAIFSVAGIEARPVAQRWTVAIPEDGQAWFALYLSDDTPAAREAALARSITLGFPLARIGASFHATTRGDIGLALLHLPWAAAAAPVGDSDEQFLTPALLQLARHVPAADLVEALRGTPAAVRLEPIYAALRRRAGEQVDAPREILELADLVDQRIDHPEST